MSRETIEGVLISSSHLFYLSRESRIFILKLQELDSSEVKYVLCSLLPSLRASTRSKCKEILLNPPYRKILSITKTKKVNLSCSNPRQIFQITKTSEIFVDDAENDLDIGLVLDPKLGMLTQ